MVVSISVFFSGATSGVVVVDDVEVVVVVVSTGVEVVVVEVEVEVEVVVDGVPFEAGIGRSAAPVVVVVVVVTGTVLPVETEVEAGVIVLPLLGEDVELVAVVEVAGVVPIAISVGVPKSFVSSTKAATG